MLLFRRQFRTLLGFLAGSCVLFGAATAAFGWHIWVAYARLVFSLGDIERLRETSQYVDLTAFFTLFTGARAAGPLSITAALLGIAVLIGCWRKYRNHSVQVWSATLTATLILSPYVPVYDTILIIPSLIAGAGVLRLGKRKAL